MRSLEGVRIVVTRAAHQAEELAQPLRELGAEVLLLPTIAIGPPSNPGPLRLAAAKANEYDWIIFTSANALNRFVSELPFPVAQCAARIAAVGAATRRAAERQGFNVSLTPEEYVAESLLAAFEPIDLKDRRILLPSAALTRDLIPDELRKRGAQVDVVEAYRNVIPEDAAERAPAIFREPYPHWVTFASPSAVENLVKIAGPEVLANVKIASIGPITSQAIRKFALTVTAEANPHTVAGMVQQIAEHPRR